MLLEWPMVIYFHFDILVDDCLPKSPTVKLWRPTSTNLLGKAFMSVSLQVLAGGPTYSGVLRALSNIG